MSITTQASPSKSNCCAGIQKQVHISENPFKFPLTQRREKDFDLVQAIESSHPSPINHQETNMKLIVCLTCSMTGSERRQIKCVTRWGEKELPVSKYTTLHICSFATLKAASRQSQKLARFWISCRTNINVFKRKNIL